MLFTPYRVCRDMDDDSAPIDYNYVSSANEAARLRQAQNIKRDKPGAAVRHTAQPQDKKAGYGPHARTLPKDSQVRDTVMRKLPSLKDGAPPAARVVYPEDYGIPDDPFAPAEAPARRASVGTRVVESGTRDESARPQTRRQRVAQPSDTPEQPKSAADMPEWLRVAQQNPLPQDVRRTQAPSVRTAPPVRQGDVALDPLGRPIRAGMARPARADDEPSAAAQLYEDAGYPQELLRDQAEGERVESELRRRRRHGAQYAVNPYQQEERGAASRQAVYGDPAGDRTPYGTDYRQQSYGADAYDDPAAAPRAGVGDSPAPYRQARPQPVYDDMQSERSPYTPDDGAPRSRGQSYAAAARGESAYNRRPPVAAAPDSDADSPYQVITDDRWQDEESDQMPAYEERAPIPWLAICMFVAAIVAVGLWLLQLTFTSQTEQVLDAREKASQSLYNKHPYHYRELIERYAIQYNIDPAFVAAIVLNESSFNPNAVSSVQARGLMQLMDDTAGWIHEKMSLTTPYSFDDMFEVETNLQYGCWYLSFLCDRFRGDPVLVSAAFHAGQNTVQNWLNDSRYSADRQTIALEDMMDGPTKQYATRVVRDYSIYLGLYYQEVPTT